MGKSIKVVLTTVIMLLFVGAVRVNAQITDEKDIPKGYKPIYTIADLYAINNDMEGNYILMADIDMSETAPGGEWDFGYGWKPIGYSSVTSYERFFGVLAGNGHRLYNMNIFGAVPYENIGLFAVNCGYIFDLAMEDIEISIVYEKNDYYGGCVGSIAGENLEPIYFCYATGNMVVSNSNKHVGGIAGGIDEIKDCYTSINIDADRAGGIMGYIDGSGEKSNCIALGTFKGNDYNPIVYSQNYRFDNCYYNKKLGEFQYYTGLSETQMKLKDCYTGFDFEKTWFIDKNSSYPYPQLRDCPQVRIESVSLVSKPDRLQYGIKDELDLTGASIKIDYEDDYSVTVPVEKDMCTYKWEKGIQTVTVDYFGKTATFDIEVGTEPEVLTVTAETSKMVVGDSFTFTADFNGSENILYSSSNSKVVKINKSTGAATAIKAGSSVITVKAGSLEKDIEVTVYKTEEDANKDDKDDKNSKTEITSDDVIPDFEMEVGEVFNLAVKKISSKKLSSSNKNVVTISKKGKVKAIAPGIATIKVKDKTTKKVVETFIILVVGETEADFEIEAGETIRVALKTGYTMKSSDESVISVAGKGKIVGNKPGTATVTVYDKSGKEYDKYVVVVTK